MIVSYKRNNKIYNFYEPKKNDTQNIYTVIVGKNGTGKSRLLNEIIENFIPPTSEIRRHEFNSSELEYLNVPKKIIAVSTSPYDKFPILRDQFIKDIYDNNYIYVGIRDLRTTNFSLGFMSKIISQLLYIRNNDSNQFKKIIQVLNYLDYSDEFHLVFEIRLLNSQLKRLLESDNIENEFLDIFLKPSIYKPNIQFFKIEKTGKLNKEKILRLIELLNHYSLGGRRKIYDIVINSDATISEIDLQDLIFLMEAGIAKLRDVSLRKLKSEKNYQISEASSGEQCIFTTLLGIACNIENNSLILIDEPEISLHPEWQEKYITLLMDTFKYYSNCHFIIATHSPQLISKLSIENCYILQMDSRELKNAKGYANNSIDFQLANIFNSPGFKNEYLLRIAMNIFSNISKYKRFSQNDLENFELLNEQSKFLKSDDPVYDMYKTILKLKKVYG